MPQFKSKITLIGGGILLLLAFCIYCNDNSAEPENIQQYLISSVSDCKSFSTTKIADYVPSDQDCFSYEYSANKLTIIHQNAGFNCCSDVKADFTISGDTIKIIESEDGAMCHCLCLYDVEYELNNISAKSYYIIIEGLNVQSRDSYVQGRVDLDSQVSGQFCLTRDYYPWGIDTDFNGSLKEYSGCGGFGTYKDGLTVPEDSNCIIYEYSDSTGILSIRHQNAVFNCCVESLNASFDLIGDTIAVTESEVLEGGGCDCICPYDLDLEILGVTPGIYNLKISSQYLNYLGGSIVIYLDLIQCPSGYDCFEESLLPL